MEKTSREEAAGEENLWYFWSQKTKDFMLCNEYTAPLLRLRMFAEEEEVR